MDEAKLSLKIFSVMVIKALAEKNIHYRLVHKEQEAIDADVKRWSSGKAGNLRAFFSWMEGIVVGGGCTLLRLASEVDAIKERRNTMTRREESS